MTNNEDKYQVHVKKSSDKKVDSSKHKNFDKVYSKYSFWMYRNPWYKFAFYTSKNRKTTLYILLGIIVIALVVKEFLKK